MINLIPPEARSRIITEYWVRVASVWLFMVSGAAILVAVFFSPTFVLVTSQAANYSAAVAEVEKRNAVEDTTARPLVVASEQARLIVEMEQLGELTPIITLVDAAGERTGVLIEQYQIQRVATSVAPVQISGLAPDRSSLAAFRDSLLATPTVTDVDLPISSFAKDRDITFAMSVSLAPHATASP